MDEPRTTTTDHRRAERVPFAGTVAIEFDTTSLVGSGENISNEGVYFTAEGEVPVLVRMGDGGTTVRARLVRFESMGGGRVGIAVRFDAPVEPSRRA
ncbi:MAG: PilZ domain-containing protein [Planctomycetes bacterium]|nr:PilZ domain-containing protein [Planctomycetota bacterium]